jgi:hypothetical protein
MDPTSLTQIESQVTKQQYGSSWQISEAHESQPLFSFVPVSQGSCLHVPMPPPLDEPPPLLLLPPPELLPAPDELPELLPEDELPELLPELLPDELPELLPEDEPPELLPDVTELHLATFGVPMPVGPS